MVHYFVRQPLASEAFLLQSPCPLHGFCEDGGTYMQTCCSVLHGRQEAAACHFGRFLDSNIDEVLSLTLECRWRNDAVHRAVRTHGGMHCRDQESSPHGHLEHLECSLQPSPPGCFTKKLSEARGNGIGFVAAGEAAPPSLLAIQLVLGIRRCSCFPACRSLLAPRLKTLKPCDPVGAWDRVRARLENFAVEAPSLARV